MVGHGLLHGLRDAQGWMQDVRAVVSGFLQEARMSAASCIWRGVQGALRRPIAGGRRRS